MRRSYLWETMIEFAFIISPQGIGPDCHRTWEGLLLGMIVLVLKWGSPFDRMYEGLPVVRLRNWTEITAENLRRWQATHVNDFDPAGPLHSRLTHKYWAG